MTEAAAQFITPVTMQALSNRPVYTSQWDAREPNNMPHINLSREADAIARRACSADFMAKLVHGRADELLSLMCLARPIERGAAAARAGDEPRDVGPPGDAAQHGAAARRRRAHARRGQRRPGLRRDRRRPHAGAGRAAATTLIAFFQPKLLAGKQVLVTAGPTFEAIDPVRGITNLLERQDGLRDRPRRARSRRRGHAGRRAGEPGDAARGAPHRRQVRARDARRDARRGASARHLHRHRRGGRLAAGGAPSRRSRRTAPAARRASASPRTPTSSPPSRAAAAAAPVLRRLRRREPRPGGACARPSGCARGVPLLVGNIGPATFGRDDNALLLVDATASGNCRAPPSSHWRARWSRRSRAPASRRLSIGMPMTTIDVKILDPRMADQLPGLRNRRQRRPGPARLPRRAADLAPNAWQLVPTGIAIMAGPGLCGADPAALGAGPQARHRAGQPGRPDRQRLPGSADGELPGTAATRRSPCSRWSGSRSW